MKRVQEFKNKHKRRPHSLKARFQKLGITLEELTVFTGKRETVLGSYFTGFTRMPEEIEQKLEVLIKELEG